MSEPRTEPALPGQPAVGLADAEAIAPFGVWEWDITRNLMRWSEGLCRLYGVRHGEFPATYEAYVARLHPDDRARVHNVVQQAYRLREPFELEERIVRPSGEVRSLVSRGHVQCDARGQPVRMVAVCQDVSTAREAGDALAARLRALEHNNEDIEQFAQAAVQGLQEPLRLLDSYVQQLSEPGASVPEWSRLIRNSVQHLLHFAAALQAYARAGQGFQPTQSLDLANALEDARLTLDARLREAGMAVTHDSLPTVTADRAQLAELFERLLDNALRYRGEAAPRVHVSATRAERYWVVQLRDNGRGFEAGQLARAFTLSVRHAPTARTPGPGIGLPVCRKIVARHGGRIWAASDGPGKGATLSFTLPDTPG